MRIILKLVAVFVFLYCILLALVYFNQEDIVFHPEKLAKDATFEFNVPFEELFLQANDGLPLNALHFKAEQAREIVLFFHGNGGCLSNCGNEAEYFVKKGYDVLMYDYRTFGKTKGNLDEGKMYLDALTAFDYLVTKGFKANQITVIGRSLGTTFAAYVAAKRETKQLILYSPYYSVKALGSEKYPFVPGFLIKYPFETNTFFGEITEPITAFHGKNDGTIPFTHAKRLKKVKPSMKLILLQDVGHNNLEDNPLFLQELDEIMAAH